MGPEPKMTKDHLAPRRTYSPPGAQAVLLDFRCSTKGMPKSMEPEWFVGDVFFPDPAVHLFRSSGYVVAPCCTLEISHGNQQTCTTCQF